MRRSAAVAALGLLLLLGQGVPAQDSGSSREQELEEIRGEIARLTARLEGVKASAAGIAGELDRLELELELQSQKVAEAASAKAIAEERAALSESEIADLEARLARERDQLRLRLTGLYRMGRHGYLRMLLSLAPGEALLPAVRALRFLAQRDAASVSSFEDLAARLALRHRELADEREAARSWFARENDRREQLVALERRKSQMLAGTQRESEAIASAALELGERARKITNLLDALSGRSDNGLQGLPIADFKGVLDWPVAGRVVAEFGPRVDPRYGTRVPHNGLDLETVPGSEVRAVYPGKVLYAAPFEGLGQMAVLQHAGRVLTLYAGLAELRVRGGDVLGLHAIVGRAGSTVYFEIRVDKNPDNPRVWLR